MTAKGGRGRGRARGRARGTARGRGRARGRARGKHSRKKRASSVYILLPASAGSAISAMRLRLGSMYHWMLDVHRGSGEDGDADTTANAEAAAGSRRLGVGGCKKFRRFVKERWQD